MTNGAQGAETGALAIGYNAVDEAQGAIDGHLQAIRGQLQDASQGWKGEAANAFAGLMGDFDTAANNLQGVLSNLGTNLRAVEGIQATQEDEATTAARNAAGGDLPGLSF